LQIKYSTNKKGFSSHFVECYARQGGTLPSARTIALGKEGTLQNRQKLLCRALWSRHSTMRFSLPSVSQRTRQRDWQGAHWSILCREPFHQSLGKGCFFAECLSELSAKCLAKGATGAFFSECQSSRHSAKKASLPSVLQRLRYHYLVL
jgi:hypothetical protein